MQTDQANLQKLVIKDNRQGKFTKISDKGPKSDNL